MTVDDTFRTLVSPTMGEFRDRGSKFLAFAYPINTEADSRTYLDMLRTQHPKAVHHCYAYRLGTDRNNYRANDDGEPSGSAGRPILNVLYSRDLTNVLVVVVRYFGGTLLGVPGLINAYKTATIAALDAAKATEKTVNELYQVRYPFEQMNHVMRLVKEQQLPVLKQGYDTACILEIEVRKSLVNTVLERLGKMEGVEVLPHPQSLSC
ncbi:IMPACT family protein [Fibrella forsythiae]|uniref:YigZ family protein n=1 Tax=Fibrella forsythiae TaxID=2817061 RepID=A0ABS3JIS0_9BACT|nr:YigZ family protein [Fibrella forsythiae]MBO0949915.1 YigZ family protein [Fibrella forsythiae]